MTLRCGFITDDWTRDDANNEIVPSGVSFYRCVMPMSVIPNAMIGRPRFSIGEGIGIDDGNTGIFGFDVVCLKLLKHKKYLKWVQMAQQLGQRIVVDVDDFFQGLHPANSAYSVTDPAVNPVENREHMETITLMADTITVSTPFLRDHYAAKHPDVRLVRNSILPSMFDQRKQESTPVLGWMGALAWRSNDLETLSGWLPKFVADNHLRFHHSGHIDGYDYAADLIGIPRKGTSLQGMVPMSRLRKLFTMDIGLVPLNPIPFNHAKCVYAKTMISTTRGMVLARDIVIGDHVITHDGTKQPVVAVQHTETREGLRIITESGRAVIVTPEHRLWANGAWVEARNLQVGDVMQAAEGTACAEDASGYVQVPWPSESRRPKNGVVTEWRTAPDTPRLEITPRWGRLLGAFVGDGSCSGLTAIEVHCDGIDADWIELLMEDFRACGLNPTTQTLVAWDGRPLRKRSVRVGASHLLRVFVELGIAEWTNSEKAAKPFARRKVCVPDVIWRSPRDVVCQFLAALFEADGTTSSTTVSLTTMYEHLARDVQLLLGMLGIQSRVTYKDTFYKLDGVRHPGAGAYKVNLNRASADAYAEQIGFLSARKKADLAYIVARPHSNAYRPMTWDDPIQSIKPCEVEKPVDIQVEGEEYVAAGLRSHNSFLKGLEYAAAGIPFVASDLPEYRLLADEGVGYVAGSDEEWTEIMGFLLGKKARMEAAERALSVVLERHTIASRAEEWRSAITVPSLQEVPV